MKLTRKKLKILINETLLLELGIGKNPYTFTRYENTNRRTDMIESVRYFFTTIPKSDEAATYQYLVEISIDWNMENQGAIYDVIFYPVAGPGIKSNTSDMGIDDMRVLTGEIDFRLFSTIVAIIRDFATKIDRDDLIKNGDHPDDPVTIKFEGTSDSRNRLYKSLLKRNLGIEARQSTFEGIPDDDAFEFDLPDPDEL